MVKAPLRPGKDDFKAGEIPANRHSSSFLAAIMAIVKWLPFVNSYIERQKRIVELRAVCVEKNFALVIQNVEDFRKELYQRTICTWDCLRSAPESLQEKRNFALWIYAANWNTANSALRELDNHKVYLQSRFEDINDVKALEIEKENPTCWRIH